MSYDVGISIIACLSGLWGFVVTFWPPNTIRRKMLYFAPFLALAIVGVVLVQAQSKQKDQFEQFNKEAQQRTHESLARSEKEVARINDGLRTVQVLLATPNASPEATVAAANAVIRSLQSPFTDTGTSLTTNRDILARSFETNEKGNGYIELTEVSTGQKLTLTVGDRAPAGNCVTGSLHMVSTGGIGTSLYLCEAGFWTAFGGASTGSRQTFWNNIFSAASIIPGIAALLSFLLMMIHRRNMLETVRPELVLKGWRRELLNTGEPEQEEIIFQFIKNVGRGAALQVHYGLWQTSDDNKPIVIVPTSRQPVIAANDEVQVDSSITVYWKNINGASVQVPLSISCLDTRDVRYETHYTLLIGRLRSNIGVAQEIPGAPGVMIGIRKVFITPVWKKTLGAYLSRLRIIITNSTT